MGQLVFQATLGGQVNLVGPNTASTFNLNVPAVSSTLATLTGTETFTNKTLTAPTLASANITTALTLTGASGANGQALTSGGSGNAPTWTTIAATPGGSTTQLQYNNAGAFGGISGVTTDGTRMTASTTIGVGAATPSTSGAGITFPATQSASSDANTLDDYEEGTWTPGFGTGWTISPSVATTATYVKIGKQVTVSVYLLNGVSTAGALITGLPFSVSVESSMTGFSGSTSTAPLMTGVTQSATTQIRSIPTATMTSLYWTVSTTYFTT
jgi:hypothetical protein